MAPSYIMIINMNTDVINCSQNIDDKIAHLTSLLETEWSVIVRNLSVLLNSWETMSKLTPTMCCLMGWSLGNHVNDVLFNVLIIR